MSDYETSQRRRNFVVGIFVVVGLTALGWLIFRFGDLPGIVTRYRSFQVFVQFPSAPGVQKDTPVRFCGYQIGRVTSVMAPEIWTDLNTGLQYYQTKVILSIDKKYATIPHDVEVKLMTRGLGSSYIELKQDPGKPAGDEFLENETLLQGSTGMTSEFFPEESQKKLDQLIEGLRILIVNANDVIGDPNSKNNVKRTLANLADASEQAKHTLTEFQRLAATGTETLKKADTKVEEVVASVVGTSKEIKEFAATGTSTLKSVDDKAERLVTAMVETSEQLTTSMRELQLVLNKVNDGQGTAARLLNDGTFYENLLENTNQLQTLLEEMREFIAEWRDKKIDVKIF
ncbi:MAG: MCE family protein [Phycisphaerales bacterium]|nr:MAG: MCE family protein [Phycisphaerales bacterium]